MSHRLGRDVSNSEGARRVRIIAGDIDSRTVTTRLVIPNAGESSWHPFTRVAESVASRARQLPVHVHDHEEVLTHVIDGFASYQLEGGPVELLRPGSARLLTSPLRSNHRVSPAQGGAIRWFNIVVGLPESLAGPSRLQSVGPGTALIELDNTQIRPLVGPRGPMTSVMGLECEEIIFSVESTTFRKVGPGRRAIVYVTSGRGTVDERNVETGEAALIEGLPGMAIQGAEGFRCIFATAPTQVGGSGPSPGPA